MTFSVTAGKAGPWRSVVEMLRQSHNEAAKSVDEAIASRKARGIPLDDRLDWRADVGDLLDEVAKTTDRDEVGAILEKARAIVSGGMQPLGPFEEDPNHVNVEVRLRALSKADVMDMRGELASVTGANSWRASAARSRAIRPFVAQCLVGVRGVVLEEGTIDVDDLKPESPEMPAILDALDVSGLLSALFTVARDYQDLGPLSRRGFGLPRPSTSPSSAAAHAPPSAVESSDAKAGSSLLTSAETPIAKPIDAPCVTSSTTTQTAAPSDAHSTSTASPALSQESPGSA